MRETGVGMTVNVGAWGETLEDIHIVTCLRQTLRRLDLLYWAKGVRLKATNGI